MDRLFPWWLFSCLHLTARLTYSELRKSNELGYQKKEGFEHVERSPWLHRKIERNESHADHTGISQDQVAARRTSRENQSCYKYFQHEAGFHRYQWIENQNRKELKKGCANSIVS